MQIAALFDNLHWACKNILLPACIAVSITADAAQSQDGNSQTEAVIEAFGIPVSIPNPTGLSRIIDVPDRGKIVEFRLEFAFTTHCEADHYATLVAPSGQSFIYMDRGSGRCDGRSQTFTSDQTDRDGPLIGKEVNGAWAFTMHDLFANDYSGSLDSVRFSFVVDNGGATERFSYSAADLPRQIANPSGVIRAFSVPAEGPISEMEIFFEFETTCENNHYAVLQGPRGGGVIVMDRGLKRCTGQKSTFSSANDSVGQANIFGGREASGQWNFIVHDLFADQYSGALTGARLSAKTAGSSSVIHTSENANAQDAEQTNQTNAEKPSANDDGPNHWEFHANVGPDKSSCYAFSEGRDFAGAAEGMPKPNVLVRTAKRPVGTDFVYVNVQSPAAKDKVANMVIDGQRFQFWSPNGVDNKTFVPLPPGGGALNDDTIRRQSERIAAAMRAGLRMTFGYVPLGMN